MSCFDCGADEDYRTHDCTSQHVPDVDGNPIRAGQLVEHVYTGVLDWARDVTPESNTLGRLIISNGAIYASEQWRVVTDTFRPPEPDTRDVTLRAKFKEVPSDVDSGALAADVEGELDHLGYVDFTVEVVDDGGHDDG